MADEITPPEEKQEVNPAPVVETPPEGEQPTTPVVAPEAPVEDEKAPRGERRHQNFIDKLSEQIRQSANPVTPTKGEPSQDQYQPLDYRKTIEVDDPKVYDQFEHDRKAAETAAYERGRSETQAPVQNLQTDHWLTRLDIDNERISREHPILDEHDEKNFDPEFTEEMTQKFLNFIGYSQAKDGRISVDRPGIRYADFVRAEFQNLDRYAERQRSASQERVSNQAAQTGVRPGADSPSTSGAIDPSDPTTWRDKKLSPEDSARVDAELMRRLQKGI